MRDRLNQLVIGTYKHVAMNYWTFGPRTILVETTKACNLKCPGCRRNYKSGSIVSEPGPMHLTVGALWRIVATTNVSVVRWEGDGEPLVNPHFKDLMRLCEGLGIKSAMATNATLLSEEYIKFLQENGMMRIHVSFDGATKDVYEKTRVGADFDKVVYNCRLIGNSKIPLFMSVVLFNTQIIEELPKYVELAKQVGAAGIHFMKMQQDSLDFGNPPNLLEHADVIKRFVELAKRNGLLVVSTCTDVPAFVPCSDPFIGPYVLLNNDVYACVYMANLRRHEAYQGELLPVPYQNYKMGNVEDNWMRDIWFGTNGYTDLRRELKRVRKLKGTAITPTELLRMKKETDDSRFSFCESCLAQWGESGK